MNTPFISLCADSSPDLAWEHCVEPDKPTVLSSHLRCPTGTPLVRAALGAVGTARSCRTVSSWWI